MKFLKSLFDIHETIGKICTTICVVIFFVAILGLITGAIKMNSNDSVVETNYFMNENVSLHEDNFSVKVVNTYSLTEISFIDKKSNICKKSGNFICVEILILQNDESKLDIHKIDTNDFKLKNHTGVYLPLNEIMGMLDLDAIDVHFDDENGGHVMSSADFDTINCLKDYSYYKKSIEKNNYLNVLLYFEMKSDYKVESNLMVLEIDFYKTSYKYRKGVDIILLPRKITND